MGSLAGLRRIVAALALALGGAHLALAQTATPFQPITAARPKIVRLLAWSESIDPAALETFQRETGFEVAYDGYASPAEIPERLREGPYDLVVLPGPEIARGVRAGAFARLDRARIGAARSMSPLLLAKLAAYDRDGAYALPLDWSPFGLIYDADKAAARLGGAPTGWGYLLDPRASRKMSDCGVSLPDARAALFSAAWRLMNVDPGRVGPNEIRLASLLIERAKPPLQAFSAADVESALARGGQCLTAGTPGQAAAAAARAEAAGVAIKLKFALPREGGAISLDALAIPKDAPSPDEAYRLANLLLRPDIAAKDAHLAGVNSALDAVDADMFKRLWPEAAYDDRTAAAIDAEWARLLKARTTTREDPKP